MATALPGKELAEALEAESRPRTLRTPLEGAKATESKYNGGEYPNAFGGYAGEGPRMSMNQMSTQLLTVSIPEQEQYLDLLRMRARQLWDEVKHGSLHADVLIRGG